jgi:hypothetical protein
MRQKLASSKVEMLQGKIVEETGYAERFARFKVIFISREAEKDKQS